MARNYNPLPWPADFVMPKTRYRWRVVFTGRWYEPQRLLFGWLWWPLTHQCQSAEDVLVEIARYEDSRVHRIVYKSGDER